MDTSTTSHNDNFKITGNWSILAGKLKENYSQLNDDDIHFATGKEEDLLTRMGEKLGKTREEIMAIIRKVQPKVS